jgi:hypothetical protein
MTPRYDAYALPHRALRRAMFQLCSRIGATSFQDPVQAALVAGELAELLELMEHHRRSEAEHVHPVLQVIAPGLVERLEGDHDRHASGIEGLRHLALGITAPDAAARVAAGAELYRAFALFLSEDLAHMAREEDLANAELWRAMDDDGIRAILARLVASIPPRVKVAMMAHAIPAIPHAERLQVLGALPPNVAGAVVAAARPYLPAHEFDALVGLEAA